MTLNQLRYLVAIVDAGLNITSAANHVHATQPGLSRQIKQLEDELGFPLFTRKGRSLRGADQAGERCLSTPGACWTKRPTSAPSPPTSAASARAG